MANTYHRAPTRHWINRRSNSSTPTIPLARAVRESATKDGAKIPRNSKSVRRGPGGKRATALKHGHVMAKVTKKNVSSERVAIFHEIRGKRESVRQATT